MDITTGLVQSSREHWRCRAVSRCFSGLTDGDQVQLTKGWQQNSELQFLGRRVRMDEVGHLGWWRGQNLSKRSAGFCWSCWVLWRMATDYGRTVAHLDFLPLPLFLLRTWSCKGLSLILHNYHCIPTKESTFSRETHRRSQLFRCSSHQVEWPS